jgi:hypothetical protein
MNLWVFKWSTRDADVNDGLEHYWPNVLSKYKDDSNGFDCFGRTDNTRRPDLAGLEVGDRAFAYQSVEQAIYGIVVVSKLDREKGIARVTVKHILDRPRKLKWMRKVDPRVELIGAFEQGPVQSMRKLTRREAEVLLDHCELTERDLS